MKNATRSLAAAVVAVAAGVTLFAQVARTPAPATPAVMAPATIPAASIPGKKITLTIANQPLRQALEEFEKQTGLRVQVHAQAADAGDPHQKLVTLDAKEQPMWEVLMGLLKQVQSESHVDFQIGGQPGSTEHAVGRPLISGPFMLVAGPPVRDQMNRLSMPMRVLKDPSQNVWTVSMRPNPTNAVDDQGNNLVPPAPASTMVAGFGLGWDYLVFPQITVQLHTPSANVVRGTKITLIEGVLSATLSDTETIEIPKGQKVEKRHGKYKLTAEWGPAADVLAAYPDVVNTGRTAPFLLVERWQPDESVPQNEWLQWRRQNGGPAKTQLFDAANKPYVAMSGSGASGPQSRTSTTITWFGPNSREPVAPGEAAKAVVRYSINARTIDIPYRFENIHLP